MSYRSGVQGLLAIGGPADDGPHLKCDVCGLRMDLSFRLGPPAWLMDGKAPKGWRCVYDAQRHTRTDYCQRCKAAAPMEDRR